MSSEEADANGKDVDPVSVHEEFDDEEIPEKNGGKKERSLSRFSMVYDLNGDGRLDNLEQKMRDLDEENRGYLTNEKVYDILEDQERVMVKYLSLKRLLFLAGGLIVILALSSFGTAFAAVMIAKDTKESNGKLVASSGDKEGKAIATQQSAEIFEAPTSVNSGDFRMRRTNVITLNNGFNANKADEMYEDCDSGNIVKLKVQCQLQGGKTTLEICNNGNGSPQRDIDGKEYTYVYRQGLTNQVTVDCSLGDCDFYVTDCPNYPNIIPFEYVVFCGSEYVDEEAERYKDEGDEISQKGKKLGFFVVKKANKGQVKKYLAEGFSVFENAKFQASSAWNHFRIDDRIKNNDDTTYNPGTVNDVEVNGTGVKVYVLDTGIKADHSEFGNRVMNGRNFVGGADDTITGDDNGHGTHVAGTIGGDTHGVAKGVDLVPVKILDENGNGAVSDVLSGLEYVAEQVELNPDTPAVVTMALSGGKNCGLNDAVNTIANTAGVIVVAGAGNGGPTDDACNNSPASATKALTVGAIDEDDALYSQSSVGTCVDMYAPGVNVLSAGIDSGSAQSLKSGTSMATAHVAGAAALMMQLLDFTAHSTVDIKAMMVNHASVDQIDGTVDNNKLLYVGDYCDSNSDCTSTGDRNVCGCDAVCSTDVSCPVKTDAADEQDGNCDNEVVAAVEDGCECSLRISFVVDGDTDFCFCNKIEGCSYSDSCSGKNNFSTRECVASNMDAAAVQDCYSFADD
mmetsp:Transcript_16165/g.22543  ORF Transcript_16165/g.22543 Transcript_16165/m.22543 type:complete len:738 (-) Transcript_16165:88-2301(-)